MFKEEILFSEDRMNILFITRKFLPAIGGMERVAYELYMHLSKITDVKLVKWGGSNKWLPLILPYFFLKSCWVLLRNRIDIIYLQDGLLSPLGLILKKIYGKKTVITIHGLDVTYKNRFYQFLIPKCISKIDKVICISQATKQECIKREIPEERLTVIPDGVSDEFYINEDKEVLKSELEKILDLKIKDKKVFLSVGRLVERKGFHWFVENVIPELLKQRNDFVYLIAGDGIFRERIKNAIVNNDLEEYVLILGKVDNETLKLLYNTADVLVMPNIPVDGDMEGFGIVALEAGSCGVPTVASDLEGMRDFIKSGEIGYLVKERDVNGFIKNIKNIKNINFKRKIVMDRFSWENICKRYYEVLEKT